MRKPFLVSIKCPECGAPIRYPEGAYTFKCSFCDSVLRTKTDGITLKYIIPARLNQKDVLITIKKIIASKKNVPKKLKAIKQIKTFYKPFWYFKGMIFTCYSTRLKNNLDAKTWYYTFPANLSFVPLFQSLGVRSEVLTIEAYDSKIFQENGVVLPITVHKDQAVKKAESLAGKKYDTYAPGYSYLKTSIIGEKFFIIFYPVIKVLCSSEDYYYTFMIDGINKNILDENEGKTKVEVSNKGKIEEYHVKLLSHRCKNCGNDLEPRDFDIIFYCKNCFRLWLLKGIDYQSQKVKILETEDRKNTIYLPFWRFEVTIISKSANLNMKTIGDLSKFMKMGRFMLRKEDPERPMRFYVPALVIRNANAIIKLAAKIGTKQKQLPISKIEDFPFEKIWNASLPEEEAIELLEPLIFLVIGLTHKRAVDFYKDFKITVNGKQLVFYPFEDKGNAILDHYHNYNFSKRAFDLNVY